MLLETWADTSIILYLSKERKFRAGFEIRILHSGLFGLASELLHMTEENHMWSIAIVTRIFF